MPVLLLYAASLKHTTGVSVCCFFLLLFQRNEKNRGTNLHRCDEMKPIDEIIF